jgi:crotonobetainyl-CoA hydratase
MAKFVRTEIQGHVLEVALDRPPANAITPEVGRELHEVFCRLRDDPELRVGILTGHGRFFSAGWDLKQVAQATDPGAANDAVMNEPGGFAGITELWDLHKPFIAAVNGIAFGGGFEWHWQPMSWFVRRRPSSACRKCSAASSEMREPSSVCRANSPITSPSNCF